MVLLWVAEIPVLYHKSLHIFLDSKLSLTERDWEGWLVTQTGTCKNIQCTLGFYSSLIISNTEDDSSLISIRQSFVVFPEKWLPRKAMTKSSGCSSFSAPRPFSITYCRAALFLKNQYLPNAQPSSKLNMWSRVKQVLQLIEWTGRERYRNEERTTLHTHARTHTHTHIGMNKSFVKQLSEDMIHNLGFQ